MEERPQLRRYDWDAGTARLELHNEFVSLSLATPGDNAISADTAIPSLPEAGWERLPGEQVHRLHVQVIPARQTLMTREDLLPHFGDVQITGTEVADGNARVWTAFRRDEAGWLTMLIENLGMTDRRCGRVVQRLLELETYRAMGLLALPLAREVLPACRELEERLTTAVDELARRSDIADERAYVDALTDLAMRNEHLRARCAQRLTATRAYRAIVEDRQRELKQRPVPRFQSLSEFLARRMTPAFRTCAVIDERLADLSGRIDRATDLLRTRVNIAIEEQNQAILAQVESRARHQLRLQETVEGLSVVAISYYAIGLLAYLLKGGKALGLPADGATALAVLPVLLCVWLGLRRMRHRLQAVD